PDLAAAWQRDRRLQSEFRVLDRRTGDLPGLQSLDGRMQVVAHQIQDDSGKVTAGGTLAKRPGAVMGRDFRGRQRQNEAAFLGWDRPGFQDSAKNLLVRRGSRAVEKKVSTVYHGLDPFRSRSFLKNPTESKTSVVAFFNQRRMVFGSISVAWANMACAARYLPTGFRSASSNACPFQNKSVTPLARASYPTTGFSPMNHTGPPCHILDVAFGSVESINSRS